MKKLIAILMVVAMLTVAFAGCQAQETLEGQPEGYPEKVVEYLVPANAGAWADNFARALTNGIELGGDTVVTNMGGGGGTIGIAETKNREADGYTISIGGPSSLVNNVLSNPDVGYDPLTDFRYLMPVSDPLSSALVVSADSGITSVDDIIEGIKAGETYTYTSPNVGSGNQMGIIAFFAQLGEMDGIDYLASLTHVPSNGTGEVLTNLQGGHMDFASHECGSLKSHVENGTMLPLMVMHSQRNQNLPDLETAPELYPGIENLDAYGGPMYYLVRADVPDEIYEWLRTQMIEASKTEEYQTLLSSNNTSLETFLTDEEMKEIVRVQMEEVKNLMDNYM